MSIGSLVLLDPSFTLLFRFVTQFPEMREFFVLVGITGLLRLFRCSVLFSADFFSSSSYASCSPRFARIRLFQSIPLLGTKKLQQLMDYNIVLNLFVHIEQLGIEIQTTFCGAGSPFIFHGLGSPSFSALYCFQ